MALISEAVIEAGRHKFVVCSASTCDQRTAGHGAKGDARSHVTFYFDLSPAPANDAPRDQAAFYSVDEMVAAIKRSLAEKPPAPEEIDHLAGTQV